MVTNVPGIFGLVAACGQRFLHVFVMVVWQYGTEHVQNIPKCWQLNKENEVLKPFCFWKLHIFWRMLIVFGLKQTGQPMMNAFIDSFSSTVLDQLFIITQLFLFDQICCFCFRFRCFKQDIASILSGALPSLCLRNSV